MSETRIDHKMKTILLNENGNHKISYNSGASWMKYNLNLMKKTLDGKILFSFDRGGKWYEQKSENDKAHIALYLANSNQIHLQDNQNQVAELFEIYSAYGNVVFKSTNINIVDGKVSIGKIEKGVYFVSVTSKLAHCSYKMIIE